MLFCLQVKTPHLCKGFIKELHLDLLLKKSYAKAGCIKPAL